MFVEIKFFNITSNIIKILFVCLDFNSISLFYNKKTNLITLDIEHSYQIYKLIALSYLLNDATYIVPHEKIKIYFSEIKSYTFRFKPTTELLLLMIDN